jgi:hypothetical protein
LGKKISYLLLSVLIIDGVNSQEIKFGWSLGDIGWSYNFIGGYDVADANVLQFHVSFEKINVMLNTSILFATNKNDRREVEPFYNSFLPLEIVYSPFKWKWVHISLYARGMREMGYIGGVDNPTEVSDGFFGAVGFRLGLIPIEAYAPKYSSYVFNIFSEYTVRNEFKVGASVDILDLILLWLMMPSEKQEEADKR